MLTSTQRAAMLLFRSQDPPGYACSNCEVAFARTEESDIHLCDDRLKIREIKSKELAAQEERDYMKERESLECDKVSYSTYSCYL